MPAALFGITNDALNLVVNLVILFLVVLWLALVAWTYFATIALSTPGAGSRTGSWSSARPPAR